MSVTRAQLIGNVSTGASFSGIVTATGGFNLGISSAGSTITAGPIKTLNFVGTGNTFAVSGTTVDISISGGGGGGLGTALSSDQDSALNKIYYVDKVLGVESTITVDPPATSMVAFTQYPEIRVDGGADFIVADGDDFIPNILGIGTTGALPALGGGGGRVRADNFANNTGTGAPTFTAGLNVTGVVTATSFDGNVTGNVTGTAGGLTGNPSITVTNATVNGVLSVGGTTVILNAATLQINDRDITLGVTTDALGNNVANDTTANHGGISIASTVGTPLINIPTDGVNNDLATNKQIMWVKKDHYTGLGTDAWITNYPISIGNTATVQNGSRLTVGAGFTVYETYTDAQSIRGTSLNITGIATITDNRLLSVGEKTTRVNGNTVNLVYNTGGGNVAICTNPTGNITLNVTGIPLTSDFDNTSITFSVISNASAGTAYSCLTVTLNGLTPTIRWAGGSSQAATAGVTTTAGYTFYSFTGINTVGSASTTSNYVVLGTVSGGYF